MSAIEDHMSTEHDDVTKFEYGIEDPEDVEMLEESKDFTEEDSDRVCFLKACEELKKIFGEVLELKKSNLENGEELIQNKQREAVPSVIFLKTMNRHDKYKIKEGRDALQKAKAKVDANHLLVQNLLYEASHLEREIKQCYLFKSRDEEIDLVPEEEFYLTGPVTITKPESTMHDDHAKHLARLEWELHQRKELQKLCKQLTLNKENVAKAIALKKERLNVLPSLLDNLRKATNPLQIALEMEIEKDWEVQRIVKLLPSPLYLLYVNLTSNAEACVPEMKVLINGDENKALAELTVPSIVETQNKDHKSNGGKQKKTEPLTKEQHQISLDELTKPHPLFVTITLTSNKKDSNGILSVSLYYIPKLEMVTASCAVQLDKPEKIKVASSNVISARNILNALYNNDFGDTIPNPKAKFENESFGISEKECLSALSHKNLGKPFEWAQKLCGLVFMNITENYLSNRHSEPLIQDTFPQIVKKLKNRWISRLELYKKICVIETKKINLILEEEKITRLRISCSLVQWTSITHEEYSTHLSLTKRFFGSNCVSTNDIFYRAVITRASAKLECLIAIPSNYPNVDPVWALCLFWNGVHNAQNSPALKDMEFWTNSLSNSDLKDNKSLLIMQLVRTMSSLDIFLEGEGPLFDPTEFSQDKNCTKIISKRTQTKPYQLVDDGSLIVFKPIN